MDEEKKELDEIQEDERELNESANDVSNDNVRNDIEEDSREESESLNDLKDTIARLSKENEELRFQIGELHNAFLGSGRDYKEPKERTYSSVRGEYK